MTVETNKDALVPDRQIGAASPAQMRRQALAVNWDALIAYARALPFTLDEAQRKYGLEVYDLMQRDGAVEAGVRKWKQEVLSGRFRIVPPGGFKDDPVALADCAFLERCIDRLDMRLSDLAWTMLDAGLQGHSLTEVTWAEGAGVDQGRLVLESLRPIPHDLYVLVQDAYGRFLGVIGWVPGHVPLLWQGPIMTSLDSIPGFVPAWKFALYSHNRKAGGIQGRSRLESAYNPYWLKYRNWALYLQHLVRFSSVIPIGIVGPDVQTLDPESTPEKELAATLGSYEESAALGLPPGTDVKFYQVPNGEAPFLRTIDAMNREILLSILGSSKTVMESKNDSQAAQSGAQDAVDEDTAFTGAALCDVITRQIFRPLIRANFGVDRPCPVLVLETDVPDFVAAGPVVAALYSAGAVEDSQESEIWAKAGISGPAVPLSRRGLGPKA